VLPGDEALAGTVFEATLAAIEDHRRAEPLTVSHLRIEPRWQRLPRFASGFRPVRPFSDVFFEPRSTQCIDLRVSEEVILAQMKQKGRYNVRVASGTASRSRRTRRSRGSRTSSGSTKRPPTGREWTPNRRTTFTPSCRCSSHASADPCSSPSTRVPESPPPWVVYFGRRATVFLRGLTRQPPGDHGAVPSPLRDHARGQGARP